MHFQTYLCLCFLTYFSTVSIISAQTNSTEVTTSIVTTSISNNTEITPNKTIDCERYNNDCKACVAYKECYYCGKNKMCYFKFTEIFTADKCDLKEIHYMTCRWNFKYLMIGVGVLSGIVFIIITIFCCYCCCKRRKIKISKDDLKWARQREERKQIALEKRQERSERTEEIRKKYGLFKNANPYQKFDA